MWTLESKIRFLCSALRSKESRCMNSHYFLCLSKMLYRIHTQEEKHNALSTITHSFINHLFSSKDALQSSSGCRSLYNDSFIPLLYRSYQRSQRSKTNVLKHYPIQRTWVSAPCSHIRTAKTPLQTTNQTSTAIHARTAIGSSCALTTCCSIAVSNIRNLGIRSSLVHGPVARSLSRGTGLCLGTWKESMEWMSILREGGGERSVSICGLRERGVGKVMWILVEERGGERRWEEVAMPG